MLADAPPSRRPVTLAVSLVGAVCAAFVVRAACGTPWRWTLFDDAMISMTYGRTLARTGELVWFPGAPRVEGITNPLWTIGMALGQALGLSDTGTTVAVILLGVAAVVTSARLAAAIADLWHPHGAGVVAALAVGLSYSLVFWSARGMEVGALTALTLSLVLFAIRWQGSDERSLRVVMAMGAICVASLLLRIDSVVVVAVTMSWMVMVNPKRWRDAALLGLITASCILTITLARHAYYGEWTPNTYQLKLGGQTLSRRLERGWTSSLKLLPVIALAALGWLELRRSAPANVLKQATLAVAIAATTVGYSMYVGGDAWEKFPNRYVTPGVALFSIVATVGLLGAPSFRSPVRISTLVGVAAASSLGLGWSDNGFSIGVALVAATWMLTVAAIFVAVRRLRPDAVRAGAALVLIMALGASSLVGWLEWVYAGALHVDDDVQAQQFGESLAAVTTDDAVIAVVWAGGMVFQADRKAVDLLGKSDSVIAALKPRGPFWPGHDKWDDAYSIGQLQPDIVAQLWPKTDVNARITRFGYQQWCLPVPDGTRPIWIRIDTTNVDMSALTRPADGTCTGELPAL